MTDGIKISELPVSTTPDFAYSFPAYRNNLTERLTLQQISDLILALVLDGAAEALDTLNELALALGNDANFATTVTNALATKANAANTYTKTEVDQKTTGITNENLATMAQATVKGRAVGTGTGTPTNLNDAALFAILSGLVPAKPVSSAGVGQFIGLFSNLNTACILPAGGSWAYSVLSYATTGEWVANASTGIAAGGTTIYVANPNNRYYGWAWRI